MCILLLVGCTSFEPIGSRNFDSSFSRTLVQGERLHYYAHCDLHVGTYMENEIASIPVYEGVLLLTNTRAIFTQWDSKEDRYKPMAWILYSDIKKIKKKNSILIRYIAIMGADDSKNAYFMSENDVTEVYDLMRNMIKKAYKHDPEQPFEAMGL